ncbi:MAG: AmmeMemoRadiSam system radical SAM enzyme [Thermodesulfobacteriota bacterium]
MTKRQFLRCLGRGVGVLGISGLLGSPPGARAQMPGKGLIKARRSPFSSRMEGGAVRCELCPRRCRLAKGKRGPCRVRENRDGDLFTLVYGNPCVLHLEPVERDPFYHVLPGSRSLCLATAGCNFECKFCQTWEVSQASPEEVYNLDVPPHGVVERAKQMEARSVAYTFVEPAVFYEYMLDIGYLAKKAGLLNLIHSNGFISPGPLRELCKTLDAANIDLKGFTEEYYREVCGGEIAPVLETLRILKDNGVHVEVTNLIVPTRNDDMSLIREMCLWVKGELGPETPIHFSRFYPLYKLRNLPPTPVSTLEAARATALSCGLQHVYIGNVPGHEAQHSFCARCRKRIIQRTGYMVGEIQVRGGKCGHCGEPVPGIWD